MTWPRHCHILHHSLQKKANAFNLLYTNTFLFHDWRQGWFAFLKNSNAASAFLLVPLSFEEKSRNMLFPLLQALFGMSGAWLVCFLLTYFNVLPTSPHGYGYQARTDINLDAVSSAEWFFMPYPDGCVSKTSTCTMECQQLQNYWHKGSNDNDIGPIPMLIYLNSYC